MICDLLISAFLLYALVGWLGDDAIDYTSAAVLAFIGIAIVLVSHMFLRPQLGDSAVLLGYAMAAVAVSSLLFLKYGVEVKRAFLIGGLFVVGSIAWKFGLSVFIASVF